MAHFVVSPESINWEGNRQFYHTVFQILCIAIVTTYFDSCSYGTLCVYATYQ